MKGARPRAELDAAALSEDARVRFEALYERLPSWEVPHPQPAFVELHRAGEIRGLVLDAGCGTGENALYLAAEGFDVWGLDVALPAIGLARAKAAARGLPAGRFLLGDALRLADLGMTFDTIIDSGLFHAMCDRERAFYVAGLAAAVRPGGRYHVLCFSDEQTGDEGPRRVSQEELRAAFADGWRVVRIDEARFVNRTQAGGARAWRATVERLG